MKILPVDQGTPEWLAARALHHCASDAPAVMGESKYKSRSDLLRERATGETEEIDPAKRALFDRGHATEASARPLVEDLIGEELYPITATDDAERLLASYDGLTMTHRTGYEHKLWNERLAEQVRAGELEPHYYWQLEHQILVGGLERVIFVCSNGTPERFVHMEYRAVPGRAAQLVAAWDQFDRDLANYQHVEAKAPAVAAPVKSLPVLDVKVNGMLTVVSNIDVFGTEMRAFIATIDMKPATDQAFADAEKAIKVMEASEEALQGALDRALAQVVSVEALRRTVEDLVEVARSTRLTLNAQVEAQKKNLRAATVQKGKDALAAHIAALNQRIGRNYMPPVAADFQAAIKGKKSLKGVQDGADAELARAKAAATLIGDGIMANIRYLADNGGHHTHLFHDVGQIILKAADDFQPLVKLRVSEFEAGEQKRMDEERERIRAEEAARLQEEERARQAAAAASLANEQRAELAPQAVVTASHVAPNPEPQASAASATTAASDASRNVIPMRATTPAPSAATRPTDAAMVHALATTYQVPHARVITWLLEMDLEAVSRHFQSASA